MPSVYSINKGIGRSIEFKGLKAQYIWWLGGGLVLLFVLFAVMYLIQVPLFVSLGAVVMVGTGLVIKVYQLSNRYGEHGMMKAMAKRSVPTALHTRKRVMFLEKRKSSEDGKVVGRTISHSGRRG